jgi:hypothetical protein
MGGHLSGGVMAESPKWVMATEEFAALWDAQEGAAFPAELARLGPTEYPDADTEHLARKATLTRLRSEMNSAKRDAMTALTRPRYTIAVTGLDARDPLEDTRHHLGIVSAWGGSGDIVVVARQRPGTTVSRGGPVEVTRHLLSEWSADLVRMLPRSRGAGRLPRDMNVEFEEIPVEFGVLRKVSASAPRSTAAAAFAHLSPTTCGTIRIQIGSEADGRQPTRTVVQYRDIPDDGRYLLVHDSPGTASGVDDATMASVMNRVINLSKRAHDSRVSAGWE